MVERGRLVERAHAELAIEDAHAVAVLLHRGLPIADLGQQPDQLPVGRLVERVEGEPATRTRDRLRGVARGSEGAREPVEHRGELPVHLVARELLPVVERGAVAEAEAGEERATVERGGLLERLEAAGAGLVRRVAVALGRRDEPAQLVDVEPDPRPRERDGIPPDLDEARVERRLERRERAAEGGTRTVGVGLGPEEPGERVASGRAPGEGEVGEQRGRLARVDVERPAVDLDQRWAEERDAELGTSASDATVPLRTSSSRPSRNVLGTARLSPSDRGSRTGTNIETRG